PAAQPYRQFLLTMLRPQRYPEVIPYVGGPVMPPYDVTSWSLPLSMGVEVNEAQVPIAAAGVSGANGAAGRLEAVQSVVWPGGDVVLPNGGTSAAVVGYRFSHAADSAFPALNRLLAAGKKVYWLKDPGPDGERGTFYVPAGESNPQDLSRLSREARIPIEAVTEAPTGAAFRVKPVRVGLYKPWVASIDEGWTRFVLERYGFAFENLNNPTMKDGTYRGRIDTILLPSIESDILERGEPASEEARRTWEPLPPPFGGGIGPDGGDKLKRWVQEGGTLVALDASTRYVINLFGLPVRNVLDKVPTESFNCPGSLLRIDLDPEHPLSHGLQATEAAFFADSPAFQTTVPDVRIDRRVVASYPADARDILVSGYLLGGERLEKRAAVVEMKVGKGRVILIGFRPQYRAQPNRTFKLLFNALYLAGLEEAKLPPAS
ncbi:MAG TPA: hypothetical protein VHU81_04235, partial [Thermoanaerobaculia bacterium]|nr:hypothetical protein [Thermoanaerobaculia bacterium]